MQRLLIGLIVLLGLLRAGTVSAFEIVSPNTAGNARIEAGQGIDDTVLIAGQSVDIRGEIGKDVFVAGSTVTLASPVGGNIIGGGQTVTISSAVDGDLIVAGGTVTIDTDGLINGDVLVFAGTVDVLGTVHGDIKSYAGVVRIDGTVDGTVSAQGDQLLLGDHGLIGGNLTGTVGRPLAETVNDKVRGTVTVSLEEKQTTRLPSLTLFAGLSGAGALGLLYSLLTMIITGLVFIFLLPKIVNQVREHTYRAPAAAGLVGVVTMVVAPALFILTMLLFVTIPLGFLELGVIGILALLGGVAGNIWVGDVLGQQHWSPLMALAVGSVILTVLGLIPVIGTLISLGVWFIGVGSVAAISWNILRKAGR
ncbi:hypothetical protein HY524_00885 [Candidatus Berkelbacteria bacterium]|nr:hypothetical protein [Candidatus Berkelbacteria bacterium]